MGRKLAFAIIALFGHRRVRAPRLRKPDRAHQTGAYGNVARAGGHGSFVKVADGQTRQQARGLYGKAGNPMVHRGGWQARQGLRRLLEWQQTGLGWSRLAS